MGTVLSTLKEHDADQWDWLADHADSIYLDGECYAFALALHRGLGWPLVGIMQGDVVRHALVQESKETLRDVRGSVSHEEAGIPFGISAPVFKRIEEADLFNIRPISDASIEMARKYGQTLWPELAWKERLSDKAVEFVNDLEALCRKHGMWIWGQIHAQMPLISPLDEEIFQGYKLAPTIHGTTFTLDRILERT